MTRENEHTQANPAADSVAQEPVAWVRRHPDGALTAEFLEHAAIEPVRQKSGAWVPLYAAPVAAQAQPWQQLAAALYQACGAYDMPVRVLDALSAAAHGEPFAHLIDDLLPIESPAQQPVSGADGLLDAAVDKAWSRFQRAIAPTDDELEVFAGKYADEQGCIHDDTHATFARALLDEFAKRHMFASPDAAQPQPSGNAEHLDSIEVALSDIQSVEDKLALWVKGVDYATDKSGYDDLELKNATIADVKRHGKHLHPRFKAAISTLVEHFAEKNSSHPNRSSGNAVDLSHDLLCRVSDALGRFVSNDGWGRADLDLADEFNAALAAHASTPAAVPEWLSEQVGGDFDDMTAGQGYRRGWNDCRAALAANAETPVDDKAHPRFLAGYSAGLKDHLLNAKTDDQLGGLLAAIQNYGSWRYAEAKGRTEPDLSDVRAAWDDVYAKVQALAAQSQSVAEPDRGDILDSQNRIMDAVSGLANGDLNFEDVQLRVRAEANILWSLGREFSESEGVEVGSPPEQDPFQLAANWLVNHCEVGVHRLGSKLMIGPNRAQRLYDVACAAAKGEA